MAAFRFESYEQQYIHCRSRHAGKPIVCWWMRRVRGTIAERVEIVLSPEACRYFRITVPRVLERKRAERIAAWGAKQAELQHE